MRVEQPALIQLLVPIYNEGENVRRLYESLLRDKVAFDRLMFVYDLDTDTSLPFIAELKRADVRVHAEKNGYGRGALNALKWGFHCSMSGPVIVLMGDNSDKLSIIPQMVQLWSQGVKVVSPSRYMKGGAQHGGPWLKGVMSRTAGVSLKLLGFPTADPTNNFKLYDGDWLRQQEVESCGGFELALELTYKAYAQGLEIRELPTEWFDRTAGESRFRLWHWLPHYLRWYFKSLYAIATR